MGLRAWLRRLLGITAAREREERTRAVTAELHLAAGDAVRQLQQTRRRIERQDWGRLYRDRMADDVG